MVLRTEEDQSSDGSDPPQLKEAGAGQVRYVLREREGGVKRDTGHGH